MAFEKIEDLSLIAGFVVKIGHSVRGKGNYEKPLFRGAGFVIFIGHFYGDESVGRAVYKKHGGSAAFHRFNG